ncbi:S-adenosyl-L-methionine-dependent methyltransferase [Cadophora sp. DSE1049]|nr:S-adenosyl-L-methionine-dependent methyltransferase [Cadophora sp. DSE1049]
MSETQHTTPAVDAAGNLSAAMQGTAQLPEPNHTALLQVDPNDEAIDLGDIDSTTSTSITSSIRNYQYENGRRYHALREGEYLLPNDEREQDRLDLHHHIFRLTLGGPLIRAPIPPNPQRVLDLGTGTGIWAMDFADEYPSALVIGNDLSPIQPTWVPANCKFVVDDIENEWIYRPEEEFDFIHGRGLCGSIRDWDRLYGQIYQHLKPGGWLEMQEYEAWVKSDDDPELLNAPAVLQWQQLVDEATVIFGKKLNMADTVKQRFIDAGFEDVREDVYKVPIGPWPLDRRLKILGLYQLEQMCDSVEAFTLAPLTRILKWSNEETQVLMAKIRSDLRNKKNHLHIAFHFVYGRKPIS